MPEHASARRPRPADPSEAPVTGIGPGQIVAGRYRVLARIGRGGGGTVYQVEHVGLRKRMALKVLNPELSSDDEFIMRFQREAIAQGSIRHRNILDVTDCGRSADGSFYYVMEELEGQNLGTELSEGGAMPPDRALPILAQVSRALMAAHERGIVHRDLKPENVFLIELEGNPDHVKVLDFGICKIITSTGDEAVAHTQTLMGTPEYMAPEQILGQPVDHRADIHAFGAVAYRMLTGVSPFRGRSVFETMKLVQSEAPPRPSMRWPELSISPRLEALIMRALEKDPERRPATMIEVSRELDACAAEPSLGQSADSSSKRASRSIVRGKTIAAPVAPTIMPDARTGTWPIGLAALQDEADEAPDEGIEDIAQLAGLGQRPKMIGAGIALAAIALGSVVVVLARHPNEAPTLEPIVTAEAVPVAAAVPPPAVSEATENAQPAPARPIEPAAPPRRLSIESIPSGAGVFEGRKRLGLTPLAVGIPVSGEQTYTLWLRGHLPAVVRIKPSDVGPIRMKLTPEPRGVAHSDPSRPASHVPAAADDNPYRKVEDIKSDPYESTHE